MVSTDCLFCKIAGGEIPSYKVFENNHVLAFLDIHPCSPGHTVVIPKAHTETEQDAQSDDRAAVMEACVTVAASLKEKLGCAGFNIGWNSGRAAGQAIGHWHVHVIPRDVADGGGSMHSIIRGSSGGPTVEEIAQKIIG